MSRRLALSTLGVLLTLTAGLAAQTRQVIGTGRIDGRIVVGDDGAMVRRAIVTISGGDLPHSRSAVSDDNGAFVFANLPSGRFTLTASRPAFITSSYGARTPGQPATRISLTPGQHLAGIVVRMARGAVITGTVRDEVGEPMPNVEVAVSEARGQALAGFGVTSSSDSSTLTDDRGVYRVFGLPAGSYMVAAFFEARAEIEMVTTSEIDAAFAEAQRTLGRTGAPTPPSAGRGAAASNRPMVRPAPKYGYAPILYPGTANAASAQQVVVAFGEERAGIDIVLTPVPTANVEGTIVSPAGPLPRVTLQMTPVDRLPVPDDFQPDPGLVRAPFTHPTPSGDFRFARVTPGRYTITARSQAGQVVAGPDGGIVRITSDGPAPPDWWASADVMATGGDLGGVQLTLRPAFRLTGRLLFEGTSQTPADLTKVPVSLVRATADRGAATEINLAAFRELPVPRTTARADGSFEMTPVYPGLYQISAGVPGTTWRLQSAIVAGRDVLDEPLVVSPESQGDVSSVVLTYTDRHIQVSGTLQTPAGAPATDYFIVVFSADRQHWRPGARRLAFSRPATDGQFVVRDLPPGAYYLAALTDLDTATWQTPEFLDQVVPGSLKITIAEGETKTQDLRIAQE